MTLAVKVALNPNITNQQLCITRARSGAMVNSKVHSNFCKHILNVKGSTRALSVYGELGRYPLSTKRHGRTIKY